jgi:hypothetical protein
MQFTLHHAMVTVDDGSLEIELSFDDDDDAVLTAHSEMTSSTAC